MKIPMNTIHNMSTHGCYWVNCKLWRWRQLLFQQALAGDRRHELNHASGNLVRDATWAVFERWISEGKDMDLKHFFLCRWSTAFMKFWYLLVGCPADLVRTMPVQFAVCIVGKWHGVDLEATAYPASSGNHFRLAERSSVIRYVKLRWFNPWHCLWIRGGSQDVLSMLLPGNIYKQVR